MTGAKQEQGMAALVRELLRFSRSGAGAVRELPLPLLNLLRNSQLPCIRNG